MNFLKPTDIQEIDTHINNTFYEGLPTQGEGIDLRIEMNHILYGNGSRKPKGHWVILRSYDRSKKSKYYNERTKEGIGGSAYEYTDILLRTRRVPKGLGIEPIKAGVYVEDKYIYYFEYNVKVKRGDHIIELYLNDHAQRPTVNTADIMADRYRITSVHPYRLENGNVQYHSVNAEIDDTSN